MRAYIGRGEVCAEHSRGLKLVVEEIHKRCHFFKLFLGRDDRKRRWEAKKMEIKEDLADQVPTVFVF